MPLGLMHYWLQVSLSAYLKIKLQKASYLLVRMYVYFDTLIVVVRLTQLGSYLGMVQ